MKYDAEMHVIFVVDRYRCTLEYPDDREPVVCYGTTPQEAIDQAHAEERRRYEQKHSGDGK